MGLVANKRRALLLLAAGLAAAVALVVGGCGGDNGAFTDRRDRKAYKTVKIDSQTWMAENLNYKAGNSWCYENDNSNCKKYGRLYDWETAKKACPAGWHLPTRDEWGTLAKFAGGTGKHGDFGTAGTTLKSTSGWQDDGNGTDDYGFSALPGGSSFPDGSVWQKVGSDGNWWTATEIGNGSVYSRSMGYNNDFGWVAEGSYSVGFGLSVRCVKDN